MRRNQNFEILGQKPSNFFRRFLSFAFVFFLPLFFTLQVAAQGEERLPQNENNLKKDKTFVDPVFKKPGINI